MTTLTTISTVARVKAIRSELSWMSLVPMDTRHAASGIATVELALAAADLST